MKTSIHIFPRRENEKEDYLILFLDEEAHAKFEADEDDEDTEVIGFGAENHNGQAIKNIIIEMVDGKPAYIRTVEE